MGKRREKYDVNGNEKRENNEKYVIVPDMSLQELQKIKLEINAAIRSNKAARPKDKYTLSQLPFIANQILAIYKEHPEKAVLNDILTEIADYMIKVNHGEKLDDLRDIKMESTFKKETLYSIHALTLFEGNKEIPKNFSIGYFAELINTRKGTSKTDVDKLIYDEEVLKFIENLGKDFRIKNPKQYLDIVSAVVYNPIKNNPSIAADPRVNENERILNILVNYARAYKDLADEQKVNRDLEIGEIVSIIQIDFASLIGKMLPGFWDVLKNKIQDCFDGLQLQRLPRDITSYTSYADFITDVNKNIVNPVGPAPHTVQPRVILNQGSHAGGMSDDDKFLAIQNLVKKLRQKDPDLVIPTVWVGYKSPFEGYIVFPFEKRHLANLEPMKEREEGSVYSVVISDTFDDKGGCFRVMDRGSVTAVLGSDRNAKGPYIQGAPTRTASNSIQGVIAMEHTRKRGFNYYEEMIEEGVEEVKINPTVSFGKILRLKITDTKGINARIKNRQAQQAQQKATTTPVAPVQQTTTVVKPAVPATPKFPTDKFGYDKFGINLVELRLTDPYTSTNGKQQARKRVQIVADMKAKYGYGRNPGLDLLDYCLEEMLVSGKHMVDIVSELAAKPEYSHIPDARNKMYAYVKNMVVVAVDNDPDYPNEKMKEIYEREIKALNEKSAVLDTEIADKNAKRTALVENTKKALSYFNTDYEK